MNDALLTKIHKLELENRHLKGQIVALKFFLGVIIAAMVGVAGPVFIKFFNI